MNSGNESSATVTEPSLLDICNLIAREREKKVGRLIGIIIGARVGDKYIILKINKKKVRCLYIKNNNYYKTRLRV